MQETNSSLEDLLVACSHGERLALRRLYNETSSQLFGVAIRILGDRQLAEDVLQDTYVKIWQRSKEFQSARGSAKAWMISILRYRAIDVRRSMKRRGLTSQLDDAIPSDGPSPLSLAERAEEISRLRACLNTLNDQQRKSVMLAYLQGWTHAELAEYLGTPLGTVKSWIRRGLLTLKDCMAL